MARTPAPRRKPGSGGIRYKKGRPLPWEAAFPIGPGRYRYDSFATRPAAEAHLDALTRERDNVDAPRNIAGGSQRVDVFLTFWLSMKRNHIKGSTLLIYQYLCELAVAEIGALRIDAVTREDAEALIASYHQQGFQNVGQLRGILKAAFDYALQEDYIKRNPFQWVKAPRVERRAGIALSEAQRAALLAAAAIEDDPAIPLCPLWHLYARLGFRRGEGLGLRRSDIDFTNGTITLAQQRTRIGKATVVATLKTKKSYRTIPVPADILELLRQLLADQVRRAAADPAWEISGLVFVGRHGRPFPADHISYRWGLLRTRAAIPEDTRIHDLRHTALTLIELGGAPANVVQAIAGHASATQTRHYTDHAGLADMRKALGA